MAIASVGTIGTTGAFASASSFTHAVATNALANGDFAILVVVANNIQTTSGASSDHTGVSATNIVATKLGEWTNGQSAAGAGVTVSAWLLEATGAVNTGSVITMSLSGAVTDKVCSGWKLTKAAGMRIRLSTDPVTNPIGTVVNLAANHGSATFSGLPSKARLYFRALGKEANTTTALTVSSGFTAITAQRSRNDAAAVVVRGEFRINTSTGETSNPTMAGSSDGAGLFIALEEYDPRPVITVQPTSQFVLEGDDAVFSLSQTGATSIQWKKYTASGGSGSAVLGSAITAVNTSSTVASLSTAAYNQSAGDAIVVRVKWEGTATPPNSVTDTAGNTYVARTTSLNGTAGVRIFDCLNCLGHAANVITVNWPSNIASYISLAPIRFTITGTASFVAEPTTGLNGTGTAVASGAFAAGDFAVSVVGTVGTGAAGSPGSGWTEDVEHGAAVGAQSMYRVDSPGGTYSATSTLASSSPWMQAAASYTVGAGGTWDNVSDPRGSGGTTDTYTLAGVEDADHGSIFKATLTNADGSIDTNTVTLTINDGLVLYRDERTGGVSSPDLNCTVISPSVNIDDGELIIIGAGIISGGSSPTISTPAGWDLVDTADGFPLAGVVNTRVCVFKRVAGGAGATVNFTANAASLWGWSRFSYDNIIGDDFVAQVVLGHLPSSSSQTLPSVDTTEPNTLLLTWISQALAQGATEPPGMTLRIHDEAGGIVAADEQIPDIGATGTRTYTLPAACDLVYAVVVLRSLKSVVAQKKLKARVGGSWVAGVLKRWNGSAWVPGIPKARVGSDWK